MRDCRNNNGTVTQELTYLANKFPALRYMKAPVGTVPELYVKYPDGNEMGTYAMVLSKNAFYAYDVIHGIWSKMGRMDEVTGAISCYPTIELRIASGNINKSLIFPNEENPVSIDRIQFKINAPVDYVKFLALSGISLSLFRRVTHFRNKQYRQILGTEPVNPQAYPVQSTFAIPTMHNNTFKSINHIPKSAVVSLAPIPLSSLIDVNNYSGGWINLPYSVEVMVRRFAYYMSRELSATTETIFDFTKYPAYIPQTNPTSTVMTMVTSGMRHYQSTWGKPKLAEPNTPCQSLMSNKQTFVSVPLGIALGMKTGKRNNICFEHGQITEFSALYTMPGQNDGRYTINIKRNSKPNIYNI